MVIIMPRLTLIAGPDGSGKSTLARQAGFEGPFVNADDIARAINPEASEAVAVAAGRETLTQLAMLIRGRRDVENETTLSGSNALRVVDRAKAAGYTVEAVFVAVPSADLAIGRMTQRWAAGGPFGASAGRRAPALRAQLRQPAQAGCARGRHDGLRQYGEKPDGGGAGRGP